MSATIALVLWMIGFSAWRAWFVRIKVGNVCKRNIQYSLNTLECRAVYTLMTLSCAEYLVTEVTFAFVTEDTFGVVTEATFGFVTEATFVVVTEDTFGAV